MKSPAILLTLLCVLVAMPLAAQGHAIDLTLFASQADIQGSNTLSDAFETDYQSGDGYGLSANMFVTKRFSAEVAAFKLSSDASMTFPGVAPFSLGSVDMTPIMAGVQFHPMASSRFDPYIGAGAAYVTANDLGSPELTAAGIGQVELSSEINYYANAGIGFNLLKHLGVVIDGRYLPYEPSSRSSVTGGKEDLDLTTLVLSAGVRFRF